MTFEQWVSTQQTKKIFSMQLNLKSILGDVPIYLANEPIVLAAMYYDGRLANFPSFRRSITGLTSGNAQISFGELHINNEDGGLDSDLTNYNWVGADIISKVGGPDLDWADYEDVIRGYVKSISMDDNTIKLQIVDKSINLLRYKPAAQTWDGALVYDVVDSILNSCNVTSGYRDTAFWTQFETDANMTCYYSTDGTKTGKAMLDEILSPLMFWYSFTRGGLFRVALMSIPTSGDIDILEDVEEFTFELAPHEKHYWKINLSYISTDPDTRTTISRSDASGGTKYPFAIDSDIKDTVLDNSTDATTALNRWWDMFSVERKVVKTKVKTKGFLSEIGDSFTLNHSRISATGTYRVVSIEHDYSHMYTTLQGLK